MPQGDTIRLRLAIPADAPVMTRICTEALAPNPISRGLHGPSGTSLSLYNSTLRSIQEGLDPKTTDAQISYVVAESFLSTKSTPDPASEIDTPTANSGTVIGFAKWHFCPVPSSTSEPQRHPSNTATPSSDAPSSKLATVFFEAAHHLRQSHIQGQPYAMITLLAIDPKERARGAGTALVRWGTEQADRGNLDCWIFCTPMAHPLYSKCGFRNVDVLDVDVGKIAGVEKSGSDDLWGQDLALDVRDAPADGVYRAVLMRRRPAST